MGEKLPSHRGLAKQLVIAPLTVKKAYDELESFGHVRSERGRGTFVCARASKSASREADAQLRKSARRLAAESWLLDVDLEDLTAIVREESENLRDMRKSQADAEERKEPS